MAGGVNKVILIGNLGVDPEVRYTASGNPVANFRIATSESWNDKEGQRQERTEWHRIVVWGRQAELAGEYLSKGRQVYIEGKLQTRQWDDREGNKRYTTEIVAQSLRFLGGRGDRDGAGPSDPMGGGRPNPGYAGGQGGGGGGDNYGNGNNGGFGGGNNQGGGGGGYDYGPPPMSDDDVPF